ncbi:hypothetical protein SynA1528_01585 [Synechococcus sp. A15-28]|nr:hypothetical protein SynA1528_01585 [Synechococcus sp. A15-28]
MLFGGIPGLREWLLVGADLISWADYFGSVISAALGKA